ncbi:VIT1/CCC1 transporter family protein [Hephaestia mangrovi]|uniref:VIT1/CCC1 transporter family protein n=1 Tax=Hephaestia mangrovi TaxID=2873268 RepID=UPI001CA628B9|nr:VIT family protein [Hephaestia mangrovi]MBY8827049.1 VIT family protein [Hephaestia mangrovi]
MHLVKRIGWLRAAVLGANDGIVSTASLVIGVAAAGQPRMTILLTGVAGLVAGAMSMAAGEYVSVSSQSDIEKADLAREKSELATDWDAEHRELALIYRRRGLTKELADEVATQLMDHDALGAHLRDELGISEQLVARPVQAAAASAASFSIGAAVPLLLVVLLPLALIGWGVAIGSLFCLAALGAISARTGGVGMLVPTLRVTFWGALAMAITAGVGLAFGATG